MTNKPYPVLSFAFWKAYLIQCRPYLFFVSGAAGLSGMALAWESETPVWRFWPAFIPFFLGYGLGQALTDTFQTDTDRISAPYRPLSQGILTIRAVRWVSLSGLFLCAASLVFLNGWNAVLTGLTILGLATYSFVKKNYWFGGPPHNAWVVALLPATGILALSGRGLSVLNYLATLSLLLLTFISYANFVLMGYLKDITADRQTGYRTFPVLFGWNATVWVGDLLAAASIGLAFGLTGHSTPGLVFWALGSLLALAGQLHAHFTPIKTERAARFPIEATVRSFILWQLAIVVSCVPAWLISLVLFYIAFEVFLYLRPERGQI